jgi:transcriptional regulator with XRE-family HTH domain
MDIATQITIRTKKLGVLMRDARLSARRSLQECAQAIGVPRGVLRAYEEGRRAPSLPELEVLVYYLKLPLSHFWGREAMSEDAVPNEALDLPQLLALRQRLIGALLRQERNNANLSVKDVADATGITTARLKSYELGQKAIPLPHLEAIMLALGSKIENFFDRSGPVGHWMTSQKAMDKFLELPEDMQVFVCQPVNRPYLELAMKLSEMSRERLRSVAEGLLDITL